jgi:serine/threonine-protein kinase
MDPLLQFQTALSDRYRVERQIGVGGMATVYLARDLRHDRNVALKLLKPELGAVLGVERFLSEIRVTANLQHPHLLPLFDSGEAEGLLFYVMPYVEGESLRGRLDREKQLPVPEAIRIAVAVAGALDYAHRHNVVHRDLKPENILLQDGQPVVSDFGIALAVTNAGGTRVTQTGLSLGTPAYMSPEQATGDRLIDARSDIYSLAAVLYEMLTGEPPHTGSTVQAIIARVLTDRVRSVRATRDTVPENVDAALQRALAKLPADRFVTAREFAEALQDPRYAHTVPTGTAARGGEATSPTLVVATARQRVVRFAPWAIAALASAIAMVSLTRNTPEPDPPPPARFDLVLPDSLSFRGNSGDVAISRDGRTMILVVWQGGTPRIAVRSMDETGLRVLQGTEGANRLFLSPDGTEAGFIVGDRLRTVSLTNGGFTTLVGSGVNSRATWGDSGIVFTSDRRLVRVSPSGGPPLPITTPDTVFAHVATSAAPAGRILLQLMRGGRVPELAVAEPDGRVRSLGARGSLPQWVESGHILYNTPDGNLMALPVDPGSMTASGEPVLVQDGVRLAGALGNGVWSASFNGTIVLDRSGSQGVRLVTVDRSGKFTALSDDERIFRLPRLSRDGTRIAIQVGTTGTNNDSDIWIFDLRSRTLSRFTSGGGNSDPIWTPDDKRIAFAGRSSDSTTEPGQGASDIFWQDVDRASPPERIYSAPLSQYPWSFTPDGRTLVFDAVGPPISIKAVTPGSNEPARDVVVNGFANRLSKLSPDGKWLAYTSNETGRVEVYVRAFPGPGGAVQVSVNGGDQPLWSRDGTELFFRDGANLIAATMRQGRATAQAALFEDDFAMSNATNYDVLPGGGFVMLRGSGDRRQLTVMVNWLTEIRRRAVTAR